MSRPVAFASRDSPSWARVVAALSSDATRSLVVTVPSLAVVLPVAVILWPRDEARFVLAVSVLAGVVVAFVGLSLLSVLVTRALLEAASRTPGVFVAGPGGSVLVPVLLALRNHESPESDALLVRLLRESATAAECVRTGRSTSGRLLPDLAVLLTRSPPEDLGFPLEVARVLTVLPLDTEWLPGTRRPIEELRERRGDLSRLLDDLTAGAPVEWALRRLSEGAS